MAAGACEGSAGQGLSLNAFVAWSKQLPAVLTSLKSLLAAGTPDTAPTTAAAATHASAAHPICSKHPCLPLCHTPVHNKSWCTVSAAAAAAAATHASACTVAATCLPALLFYCTGQ